MRQIAKYYVLSPKTQPFSPLDLSPALWLDASDTATITASSGSVSQWDDKSVNGRNVTQGTAAAQPTTGSATLNGLNVLSFDGDWLRATGFTVNQPDWVWIVMDADAMAVAFDSANVSNRQHWYAALGALSPTRLFAGTETTSNSQNTAWQIAGCRFNGASSYVRVNEVDGSTVNPGSQSMNGFTLGQNHNNGGAPSQGKIAEVIIIPGTPSVSDISNLETYLKDKWGL